MFGVRKINPQKIVSVRGKRSRKFIAAMSEGSFTEQDLYNWEKGLNLPRPEKQLYLVKALGVKFEDISDEVSFEIAV